MLLGSQGLQWLSVAPRCFDALSSIELSEHWA